MELTDERQIAILLASSPLLERRKVPRMSRKRANSRLACTPPEQQTSRIPCRCGTCAECRENLRWERIFQAKFADPDYYVRPVIRCGSPLNEC
jgi:hypothetical protein